MSRRIFALLPLVALAGAVFVAAQAPPPGAPPTGWSNQKKEKGRDPNVRNLQGQVMLPDNTPAEGAVVKLKNLKTLQVRSYITQKDGKYIFQNLSTNVDYEVKSDYKEFSSPSRTLSVFDSRLDAVINLKLEPNKDSAKKDTGEKS